jgi:hypothetical protein
VPKFLARIGGTLLVAAILGLTVALPLHALDHLRQPETPAECPLYAWAHDSGAGITATVPLLSMLVARGILASPRPPAPEPNFVTSASSRAPPA